MSGTSGAGGPGGAGGLRGPGGPGVPGGPGGPSGTGVNGFRRYASTVAVFATVLYLALLIATFGEISLNADIDVLAGAHVDRLVAPTMIGFAVLVFLACLLWIALRIPAERQRILIGGGFAIGLGCYATYVFVGGIVIFFSQADAVEALLFIGRQFATPFAISVGVIALILAILYMMVITSRFRETGRPLWPWERKEKRERRDE